MTMSTASDTMTRPPSAPGLIHWLKKNLFSTWYNALLTFVAAAFVCFVLRGVLTWVFVTAKWDPVTNNFKLFAVGQYPNEELWRVGAIILMVSFLMGVSWGLWGGTVRTFALALAVGFGVIALLPVGLEKMGWTLRLWFLANPILTGVGYLIGRTSMVKSRWVVIGWLLSFVLSILLLRGIEGNETLPLVGTGLWGGLLLTFLLAIVGIVASFPIGVLLALGRRSSLPVVKIFCTLFIELVRGVPLVTILFMFSIILPLFLPEDIRIDRVLRAMMAMTFFAAAYMAENVRGGLQAIPKGQYEAAEAVGLNAFQTMLLIVLPQALRAVIPAIVGQFIALFMDTTLAIIVGLVELLAVGKSILNSNVEWLLLDSEVYIFIAAVFWIFTYSMSYASRRLETALGVGER
jgi:general L-amino acid transport system permease protein